MTNPANPPIPPVPIGDRDEDAIDGPDIITEAVDPLDPDDQPLDPDLDDDQIDSADADRRAATEGTKGEDPAN
ncbi:MAG: hypothetical protein ABWY37_11230 [Microbacterium pygmaeum]